MLKRVVSLLLLVIAAFSLIGCGDSVSFTYLDINITLPKGYFEADAGESDALGAEAGKLLKKLLDILLIILGVIRHTEHKGCLGEVRYNEICLAAELCHRSGKLGGKALVEHTVVSHNRVDNDLGLIAEAIDEVLNKLELLE